MKNKQSIFAGLAILSVWVALVGGRLYLERDHFIKKPGTDVVIGSNWDPRNSQVLDSIVTRRETESFKEQSYSGRRAFVWPGLRAAQVSWAWLEMLQGLHVPSSSEGDYSWMFSKLNFIAQETPPKDIRFLTGLASFFLVIGSDYIGANLLMRELQLRVPEFWKTWFWSGFHALENLRDRKVAGYCFREASMRPGAPDYFAALSLRLEIGESYFSTDYKKKLLESEFPKEFVEKVLRARQFNPKSK